MHRVRSKKDLAENMSPWKDEVAYLKGMKAAEQETRFALNQVMTELFAEHRRRSAQGHKVGGEEYLQLLKTVATKIRVLNINFAMAKKKLKRKYQDEV